jgi:hypothetical protein
MPLPNCTIEVSYYPSPNPAFGYCCVSHSPAWHVGTDGTICPPLRSRRIQLSLADPSTVEFVGIRISSDHATVVNSTATYLNETDI